MRAVQATAIVWILCRFAFWIGYHRSAAMRGLGAAGVMLVLIVLIYLVARIAFDLGGPVAAAAAIALFVAIEFVLFRTTRARTWASTEFGVRKLLLYGKSEAVRVALGGHS